MKAKFRVLFDEDCQVADGNNFDGNRFKVRLEQWSTKRIYRYVLFCGQQYYDEHWYWCNDVQVKVLDCLEPASSHIRYAIQVYDELKEASK